MKPLNEMTSDEKEEFSCHVVEVMALHFPGVNAVLVLEQNGVAAVFSDIREWEKVVSLLDTGTEMMETQNPLRN